MKTTGFRSNAPMHRLEHSFGFQEVTPGQRQSRIRAVFAAVAPRYDLMNDLMSFGVHRLWKRAVARQPAAYHYLIESIRRFPDQREFAAMLEAAGFRAVAWRNLSFGIACLH